jgi:acyl-CoA synthetase (AMP-forming)/AMP-acid ligase II
VPRPGESVTLEDIVEHLKGLQVASYKWPQEMVVMEALPRNPLGKVLRRELTM